MLEIRYSPTSPLAVPGELMDRRAETLYARSPAARATTLSTYNAVIAGAIELLSST